MESKGEDCLANCSSVLLFAFQKYHSSRFEESKRFGTLTNQSINHHCIIIIIILSIFLPFSEDYLPVVVVPITQLITFIFPHYYYYNNILWLSLPYQIGDNYKVKLCDLGLATVTEQKKRMTVCGTNVRVHSINNNNNPIVS